MKRLSFIILLLPVVCAAQTVKFRKYKEDEMFRYKLTTEVYRNEQMTASTEAVSFHSVEEEDGVFFEKVKWYGKLSLLPPESINMDSIAQEVPWYNISLSPKGSLQLPKLSIPEMTGEITDLNTFYVAIAPALNAQKLSAQNPIIKNNALRQGNFADSLQILYGTDCLQVTQRLISTDKKITIIETSFTPPASLCLTPLLDTIGKKTFDHFNNIQFIRKSDGDKVNLFWGVETFTITSRISNRNGQIIDAKMENILTLRMRYNATADLSTYSIEMPVKIRRVVVLELVGGEETID